jgi:endonuclease YncB( thermonuclease family)
MMASGRRWLAVAATALAFLSTSAGADTGSWRIVEVYDGDTVYAEIAELPPTLRRVGLRLAGIDAPEIGGRARCQAERARAVLARDFVQRALAGAIVIKPIGWDKYGGRVDVEIFADGASLADQLVAAGLARRYDGKSKRLGWCG